MYEQTFKNIDDILFKDAGCSNELAYFEQTSFKVKDLHLKDSFTQISSQLNRTVDAYKYLRVSFFY